MNKEKWAKDYDKCTRCGEKQYPYAARGLCYVCYPRVYNTIKSGYIPRNKWARDHDCCINCGTDAIRHEARGYCQSCYNSMRIYKENFDPTKCGVNGYAFKHKPKF